MKKIVLVVLVVSVLYFGFDIRGGINYDLKGTMLYNAEANLTLSISGVITNGFVISALYDSSSTAWYGSLGTYNEYNLDPQKKDLALYGSGSIVFPIEGFDFNKITGGINLGIRYYIDKFSVDFGLFAMLLYNGSRFEGIRLLLGYTF